MLYVEPVPIGSFARPVLDKLSASTMGFVCAILGVKNYLKALQKSTCVQGIEVMFDQISVLSRKKWDGMSLTQCKYISSSAFLERE